MSYRYIKNLLDKKAVKCPDLTALKKQRPKLKGKLEYRKWCKDKDTEHVFYSLCEGDNANLRIDGQNPLYAVSGLVADYDANVDWGTVDDQIRIGCKDLMPTWRTKTFSNYIRLIWEFDEKIPVSSDMYSSFCKRMSTKIGVERVLPGFDQSSFKSSQYFELGEDWQRLGDPLSKSIATTALLQAAKDTPPTTSDVSIPMDILGKEIKERWPNRWEGDFYEGARGPLFWIDDGIEREGCQVAEHGMICYSDRGHSPFLTWRELLGSKFVEEYEGKKIQSVLDQYWFNGNNYFKLMYNRAVKIPDKQLNLELRKLGFSPKPRKKEPVSELEDAVDAINNQNRIDAIAPVVFSKERVLTYHGKRILNESNNMPIEPAETGSFDKWPWLYKFLNQFLARDSSENQLPYLLSWAKRAYEALREGVLSQGQALILVGPAGRGKTLLSGGILAPLFGGCANASDYLSGKTSFNKDLGNFPLWAVDDTVSAASFQDQRRATELIKRGVANPNIEYHAKYADSISIPMAPRILLTLNMDPNSLSVIPSLDQSNRDKIIALRISMDASEDFPSNADIKKILDEELPYFAAFLLEYDIPKNISGNNRFGVKSYIDDMIANAAYDNSRRSHVAELVEYFVVKARSWFQDGKPVWTGTLTEMQSFILEFSGGRHIGVSNNLDAVRRGMLTLEDHSKNNKNARPIRSSGAGAGKVWEISLEEKFDLDREPIINRETIEEKV